MSDEWRTWETGNGHRYRWVEHDDQSDFGEIWYNADSDVLFIRKVQHEFETKSAQVIEGKPMRNCFLIGDL